MRWLLFVLLAVAGCGDADNTAYLPVGSRCTSSGQCGTNPYQCNVDRPGGYCEKPCATDGDCPMDSVCIPRLGACRRRCADPAQCRASEGYACYDWGGTSLVCEATPPPA